MIPQKKFTPLCVETKQRKVRKKGGVLTIICSEKNGKRILLSEQMKETLGIKDTVQLGFLDNSLVIGKFLSENATTLNVKTLGKKSVIYSTEAVRYIVSTLGLRFTDKVSYTFYDVQLEEWNDVLVAILHVGGDM